VGDGDGGKMGQFKEQDHLFKKLNDKTENSKMTMFKLVIFFSRRETCRPTFVLIFVQIEVCKDVLCVVGKF
jgi:hypothetical protein